MRYALKSWFSKSVDQALLPVIEQYEHREEDPLETGGIYIGKPRTVFTGSSAKIQQQP